MKINSKINKRVNESVADCRRVLTEATIELLKQMGAKEWENIKFGHHLMLFQTDKKGMSETILADRVCYSTGRDDKTHIVTCITDDFKCVATSRESCVNSLSLSNLQIIYDEVRRMVRDH